MKEVSLSDLAQKSLIRTLVQWPQMRIINCVELSGGLSSSSVFRIHLQNEPNAKTTSLIGKGYSTREHLRVERFNSLDDARELLFFQSPFAQDIQKNIRLPQVLGTDLQEENTWIWMEDLESDFSKSWSLELLQEVPGVLAGFHEFFLRNKTELVDAPWLNRREYAAYTHYHLLCMSNLETLQAISDDSFFVTREDIAPLKICLENAEALTQKMDELPLSFCHGDFHIKNIAPKDLSRPAVIDWAQVGLAPLGSDLATLVSLYELFGGKGVLTEEGEEQLLARFIAEVQGLDTRESEWEIRLSWAVWHLTWGLHLRLGPGLRYVLQNMSDNSQSVAQARADIQSGIQRALRLWKKLP